MPRTSAAHATEMRQRILDGAHRAMLSGGYRGTTMPAIAAEAGVSVGLLYRYFDSKEELYLAMCEAVTQAQLDELAVQLGQIADARERLGNGINLFVDSLEVERWGLVVIAGWAEADVNPALRDMLRRRCDQIRGFIQMFLREAVVRGELEAAGELEELALATTMLLDGV
ncbi:MAG: TetR/AcrR family transcriptional regulator, partial [Chloroflexota bacterium]|nr:TetR/AcrR family transcriptional regulator [Chloroflexota bacterium]